MSLLDVLKPTDFKPDLSAARVIIDHQMMVADAPTAEEKRRAKRLQKLGAKLRAVRKQERSIRRSLQVVEPEAAKVLRKRLTEIQEELDMLQSEIEKE